MDQCRTGRGGRGKDALGGAKPLNPPTPSAYPDRAGWLKSDPIRGASGGALAQKLLGTAREPEDLDSHSYVEKDLRIPSQAQDRGSHARALDSDDPRHSHLSWIENRGHHKDQTQKHDG